jgi:hypothetical protein
MTLIKSLKYKPIEGKETLRKHRIHTSKKNRRPYPISLNCKVYKDRLQRLKERELQKEVNEESKLLQV